MLSVKLVSHWKLLKHVVGVDEVVDALNVEIAHCLELRCLRALDEEHKRSTGQLLLSVQEHLAVEGLSRVVELLVQLDCQLHLRATVSHVYYR